MNKMSAAERQALLDYVLGDATNFRVALNVWLTFDDIKARLFEGFSGALERELVPALNALDAKNEWRAQNLLRQNPFSAYKGIYLSKGSWKPEYSVALQPESGFAHKFIFGIRSSDKLTVRIKESSLAKLDDQFGVGNKKSEWWDWYQWVEAPYGTWEDEVLMNLYERTEAIEFYLNRLAGHGLVRFAQAAAPIIEEMSRGEPTKGKAPSKQPPG